MRNFAQVWGIALAVVLGVCSEAAAQGISAGGANLPDQAEQVFALANRARTEAGAPPLRWDAALATAAVAHCRRMVAEGQLGHRFNGELELVERAGTAGAHFSLIEENVAMAATPMEIHGAWMTSSPHRRNLLNPEVDRVGIAVIASRGELYAVADYTRGSQVLSAADVEQRVARMIAVSGVKAAGNSAAARAACTTDRGMPHESGAEEPTFVMRWQDAELKSLPEQLTARLASGKYRRAAIGSCPARGAASTFTLYRVAVLLY